MNYIDYVYLDNSWSSFDQCEGAWPGHGMIHVHPVRSDTVTKYTTMNNEHERMHGIRLPVWANSISELGYNYMINQ